MVTYLVFNANGDLLDGENKTRDEATVYAKHLKAGDRIMVLSFDHMEVRDVTALLAMAADDQGDLPPDCYAYREYIGIDADPAATKADADLKLEREYC